jgi:lysophospholipid acyltransferase (LPLAT)-like uncharacterized protein
MKLLSLLGYLFLRALHATMRVRHVNAENVTESPRYILAFWHRHIILSLHSKWRPPTTAIISRSKDGEIVSGVLHFYGAETARGSSTRGGDVALREILRAIRAGNNIAFTPDGPKGPPCVVKDGVIYVAKMSGLPIVPFAFAAKKKSCCARGIGWFSLCRSHAPSTSMVRRCLSRATATRKSGGGGWKRP